MELEACWEEPVTKRRRGEFGNLEGADELP
jgi:hypothetical protein